MQTTQEPRPTLRPGSISGTAIAVTGALSLAAAAGAAAYSSFRGPAGKLSDYLLIVAIVTGVAIVTFAVVVPRALGPTEGNRPAATALALGILAALSVAAFWSGAPLMLGSAAFLLGLAGRRRALAGASGAGIAAAALALAVLAFAGQIAAVVTDEPVPERSPQRARIAAGDGWRTTGFDSLEAGWVTIAFETLEGPADHGLQIVRLKDGTTFDAALEAVQSDDIGDFLDVAEPIGGLVGVRGAQTLRLTLRLDAGSYAMFDFGGGPEGPNFMNGMTAAFDVARAEEPVGSAPATDGEIVLTEYTVEMPVGFSGNGTYLVRNDGAALHELNIGALPPGADAAAEVEKHAEAGRGALEELPGVAIAAPGAEVYVELDLDPGSYVFACFLTVGRDDPVHALEGMWSEVTIG